MKTQFNQIVHEDIKEILTADLPWSRLSNKKILITGGGGLLASYLVKAFLSASEAFQLNLEVHITIRTMDSVHYRLSDYLDNPRLKIHSLDIKNPISSDFQKTHFVIHCASQASPKFYGNDPVGTLTANTIGTYNLLEYATRCNVEKFLFFSSGEVYGTQIDGFNKKISEECFGYLDPMQVRSCYGESKRMGENMCVSWSHQFGVNCTIVRPFHTYGPGLYLNDGRVFADFVSDIVNNRDIILKSDGAARRPLCYIADSTQAFLRALLLGQDRQAYNVANPTAEISIKELAELLTKLFPEKNLKVETKLNTFPNGYLASPITGQLPDIRKISDLGWIPKTSLKDGFRRTVLSFG